MTAGPTPVSTPHLGAGRGKEKSPMHSRPTHRRPGFLASCLVVAAVATGATACSSQAPVKGEQQTSAGTADAKQVEKVLNAALEAHADGDLETAAAKYHSLIKADPDNKFAFYNLALIDEANGNYGLAEDNYRKALESDP